MRIIALCALAALLAAPAAAPAAPAQERRFTVTDFNQVRLDGGYRVALETARAPYAVATGNPAALDGVRMRVEGRTLIISADRSNWSGRERDRAEPVAIRLGTHGLRRVWVNGSGLIDIDRVEGPSFGLALQGAGRGTVGALAVEQFDLALNGAASARVAGEVEDATLIVRGMSLLDGEALESDRVTLGVEGPSTVTLGPAREARIDAVGTGEIMLAGRPSCELRLVGAPLVTGCR
ncbi:GIN domain-containing protein [Sphingomicrobium astaxanthinifaciens]|uniref:GIN domain-containing protein n=1 Tax=Sphingomicrobium astaxanthinifaciens TaxID=1227949 RepID=UPI001FCC8E34|nr:DUF2807 domain-containing protein [Sphingomicrobium astaxanthinifaciens]MCJ7421358.1 DUF2807 domain-containing protein [Sphingomicrobium astaxanthinifaciens]